MLKGPLAIDVLIHQRELWRPSSTGQLIARTLAGARQHLWLYDKPVAREEVARAERELWVLHPHGAPLPEVIPPLDRVQVVLLDGAWREATFMAREVANWGRMVSLPMEGQSRYWLRAQQTGARFSTVEALIFLLRALGLVELAEALRVQFELQVYAGLRSRGAKELAAAFLRESPLSNAVPDMLAKLETPRPR